MAMAERDCGALGQAEAREGRWDLKRGRPLFSNLTLQPSFDQTNDHELLQKRAINL